MYRTSFQTLSGLEIKNIMFCFFFFFLRLYSNGGHVTHVGQRFIIKITFYADAIFKAFKSELNQLRLSVGSYVICY